MWHLIYIGYSYTLKRPVRFIIVDGDVIEQKNLIRQNFIYSDLGENKARVLAMRYACAFGLEVEYISTFIEEEERLLELLQQENHECVILIGAVDNNKSRKMCHTVFNRCKNLIYIDSGNGEYSGQVVCGIRKSGRTVWKPVASLYPDILSDEDMFPTELSCADAAISAPQSIVANIMASTAVVTLIYNLIVLNEINTQSITFSTKSVHLKPVMRQKNRTV